MNQHRRRAFWSKMSRKAVPDSARTAHSPSSEMSADATLGEMMRAWALEVEHGPELAVRQDQWRGCRNIGTSAVGRPVNVLA